MDLNFEQMLASHNQEFKESEVYSNWMPPDADYVVSLVKLETGQKTDKGVVVGWWKLTGRIEDVQDEKLNGKEFTVGFYTSKAYGILKGAARILSGNPHLDDLAEAHAILEASIGSVLSVRVKTSWSDKYKKDFTNCYILEVIDTTETSVEDVSNATTPAPIETHLPEEATYSDPAPVADVPVEVPAEAPPIV